MKEIAAMSITVLPDEDWPTPEDVEFLIGYITPDGAIKIIKGVYPIPEEWWVPVVINLAQAGVPEGVLVYPESSSTPGVGMGYRQAFICQHRASAQIFYTLNLRWSTLEIDKQSIQFIWL